MTAVDTRVQVRLSDDDAAWLAGRSGRMMTGSTHQQARAEISLWRMTLAAELRGVRLTVAEATCVADVAGGDLIRPAVSRPGAVYAACYDAFAAARGGVSSYGAKHGIDEAKLLDYLQGLGPAADMALADAISRWWATDGAPDTEGFAAVGLRAGL